MVDSWMLEWRKEQYTKRVDDIMKLLWPQISILYHQGKQCQAMEKHFHEAWKGVEKLCFEEREKKQNDEEDILIDPTPVKEKIKALFLNSTAFDGQEKQLRQLLLNAAEMTRAYDYKKTLFDRDGKLFRSKLILLLRDYKILIKNKHPIWEMEKMIALRNVQALFL